MKKLILLLSLLLTTPAYASDLVGHWKMDDNAASTTVIDHSGHGNTGTFNDANGDPNTDAHTVAGAPNRGSALTFDGTDDYVDCGSDESLDITEAITVEAWVKVDDATLTQGIINKVSDNLVAPNYGTTYGLMFVAPDLLYARIYDGTNAYTGIISGITTDTWYHVVMSYDGSYLRLYLDGTLRSSAIASGSIETNNNALEIGRRTNDGLNGSIDSVRIYNRALSAEEILHQYNQGGYRH